MLQQGKSVVFYTNGRQVKKRRKTSSSFKSDTRVHSHAPALANLFTPKQLTPPLGDLSQPTPLALYRILSAHLSSSTCFFFSYFILLLFIFFSWSLKIHLSLFLLFKKKEKKNPFAQFPTDWRWWCNITSGLSSSLIRIVILLFSSGSFLVSSARHI